MASTFLDDLKPGIAKLQTSQTDREKSRVQRVSATKGLSTEEKNGRAVLSVLDALVKQALAGENEALLRKWQSVRLIRRSTANTSAASATSTTGATTTTSTGGTGWAITRQSRICYFADGRLNRPGADGDVSS